MNKGDWLLDDDELLERFGRIRKERYTNMDIRERYDKYITLNQWDIEETREAKERLEELRELKSERDYEMKKDEINLYPGAK